MIFIRINLLNNYTKTLCRNYCTTSKINIAPGYQPRQVENNKREKWIAKRQKSAQKNKDKPKFSMILPPPNVTGLLHLGHALTCTVQDVICRRKEQQGYNVVWVPGTDHAGIATQVVVEKKLLKENNLTRHDLGREKFIEKVWNWKTEKCGHIAQDLKKIGCILDWEREYFTMDKTQENAVKEAFIRLFDEGLIIRKNSLVNWSCSLESAISDIEVETKEISGPITIQVPRHERRVTFGQLYDIAYKITDSEDEEIIVSTTRPETLLGDVAVAVNPNDEKYKKYAQSNTKLWHPFRNEEIPLIFDETVDQEFGTGAVKITPAHDRNDFEIAKRHFLPRIQVFNEKGEIIQNFQKFSDLPRFDAREKIINDLSALNLLKCVKPHKMILPLCSRSKDIIEYIERPQWFVKCDEMARSALEAVEIGKLKIIPPNFETDWHRWLSNSRDWCISRQLWWGHKIPAYKALFDGKEIWIAAYNSTEALQKAKIKFNTNEKIEIVQDTDVLDTWFSSSLLPFSVFGWPKKDSCNLYPLDLMETGHDILFFWVARMVMLGQKLTGDIPFRNILLNGIICDVHGRKMSKSLGNIILPEQVIYGATFEDLKSEIHKSFDAGLLNVEELKKSNQGLKKMFPNGISECGTDALRFTLCSHNIKNHFINFDVTECHTNKLFFNKIWQATRYTLSAFEKLHLKTSEITLNNVELSRMDKWILSRLANTRRICNQNFENYNLHLAASALKTFFYSNFCDVYLETTKSGIAKNNEKAIGHCSVLAICLSLGLQTMTPLTPFLSEELLQYFPDLSEIIDSNYLNQQLENEVNEILEICMAVRQYKSQQNITKKHEPKIHLFPQSDSALKLLGKYLEDIRILCLSNDVFLEDVTNNKRKNIFKFLSTAGHLCSFGISTNENYDKQNYGSKLNQKKLDKLQNNLEKLLKIISSPGFKQSADEVVQKKHLETIKQLEVEISNIKRITMQN